MKFIFPQNYDFSSKLFGFIDYSTAIMDLLIFGLNILIGHLLFNDITVQIIFFVHSLNIIVRYINVFNFYSF